MAGSSVKFSEEEIVAIKEAAFFFYPYLIW